MKTRDSLHIGATRLLLEKWDDEATDYAASRLWIPQQRVDAARFSELRIRPDEVLDLDISNLLLDSGSAVGAADLIKNLLGTYTQAWDTTHTGVAVGDSATAAAATQTDLQAASNKWYEDCDSTFPAFVTTQICQFKSSYVTPNGDFAWQEFGIIIPGTSAPAAITPAATKPANYTLLNRAVQSLGTKTGGTWTLTVDVTFT